MTNKNLYCPSCGEEVPVYEFATDLGVELRCAYCSFPLELTRADAQGSRGALVLADDAQTILTLVKDFFQQKGTFAEIHAVENGGLLVETVTRLWHQGKQVALVIIDIKMPVLNGAQAAVALRWVEKGFGIEPTPFIFLSGLRIDEGLKKVMAYCSPSYYMNKAVSQSQDDLMGRLETIANTLIAGDNPGQSHHG